MTDTRLRSTSDIKAELNRIDSLINAANRLIGEDRLIDLAALESRTHAACDAAIALEGNEGRELLPDLERVISNLDELAENLTRRFGGLPNLNEETTPSSAAMAYGRSHSGGT